MRLYRTAQGAVVENSGRQSAPLPDDWDSLLTRDDLFGYLSRAAESSAVSIGPPRDILAPISRQEVWAAGVTYFRSRDARMEESKAAGGGSFYDRVYHAERPELFFKATPHRVAGPGQAVAIRRDAAWSVPEPELALLLSPSGQITGYTVGNDMSARDIEGENPLYLPQAKVYDRSCALGPCILVTPETPPPDTEIRLEIARGEQTVFAGVVTLAALKRSPALLAEYLFRQNSFPHGCFLLTGTGIVPPDSFTLALGDEIRITIPPIGTLVNTVG